MFFGLVIIGELAIAAFIGHFIYRATAQTESAAQWRWTTDSSRAMWNGAAETMITASGIAAALVASLGLGSHASSLSPSVLTSVKFSVECLVACVCSSMALILALSRGHESALARAIDEHRRTGLTGDVSDGALSNFALSIILATAFISLSSFFVGFLLLGRVVWRL